MDLDTDMVVDLLTDNSGWVGSPRISFSHDLPQEDDEGIPIERSRSESFLLDASSDFDFFIAGRLEPESTSADELFYDGKILPLPLKKSETRLNPSAEIESPKPEAQQPPSPPSPPQPPPLPKEQKKESLREMLALSDAEEKSASSSKPFWRFNRSSSLNVGNTRKISSRWSLPLLSRSKSTGSAATNLNSPVLKDAHSPSPKSPPNSTSNQRPSPLKRPPTKKNGSGGRTQNGYYGSSVKINPVLVVPPPYISQGTSALFGFGYFFCNGKEGKTRKKPFTPLNA